MKAIRLLSVVLMVGLFSGTAAGAPKLNADGLHVQPWINQSSGDLSQDLAAAAKAGKKLLVIWEQRGCGYCKQLHEVNFQIPEVVKSITDHFYVVQMDMRGERATVDFDGTRDSQAKLAVRQRVRGTPTLNFYDAAGKEIYRMPGYAEPLILLIISEYVAEGGYLTASLGDWARQRYPQ